MSETSEPPLLFIVTVDTPLFPALECTPYFFASHKSGHNQPRRQKLKRYLKQLGVLFLLFACIGLVACGEDEGPGGDSNGNSYSHNPGRNCIECHGNLKYAGTVYTDISGGSTIAGEIIVITETDGSVRRIESDGSGNFYTSNGNPGGGYTVTVEGNTVGMVASATNGGCSAGGCHDGSSTARVYVN